MNAGPQALGPSNAETGKMGEGPAKETEKEELVGIEGDPGGWYTPEAKWHLACCFFFFLYL